MPVSTRSQISGGRDEANVSSSTALRPSLMRNPHHGLKEKMRALTQFYEQHKNQMAGAKDPCSYPTHHPSVDLADSNRKKTKREEKENVEVGTVMRENNIKPQSPSLAAKKPPIPFPIADAKENQEGHVQDPVTFYSCPRREHKPMGVARKLSLESLGAQSEGGVMKGRRTSGEMGVGMEKSEIGSRIMVFVRLRPITKKEVGSGTCVRIVDRRDVYLTESASETDYLRLKRVRGGHFSFDASFPDMATQQEVYTATTSNLVEGVLQGRNGSVFCYGATGAGKTYTMLGTQENPGVMVLAIKDLFSKIKQRSCDGNHVVHLSYLEVYNEAVRDLLAPGRPLVLREDKQGIVAAGLTQYRAYSTDEVMALLQQGNLNRTTEPTWVNETSSRSHAILQVVAEYREQDAGNVISRVGKLSLIDLAGSERALATEQRTQRLIEGANINRSLLALSSCINALVEGKKHIPYRNSKLTQLLKDSLGGHCNTVMIANISPSSLSFGETQNTLHWADRAKEIKTKGSNVNEEVIQVSESDADQAKLLLELQKENGELRQQLARLQQKLLSVQAQSMAANSNLASPQPSSLQSTPQSIRKPMRSIFSGNCFSTPESKKKPTNNVMVQELQHTVTTMEMELERIRKEHTSNLNKLKKEHNLQIKQKDDLICELITKSNTKHSGVEEAKRIVTRASLRKVAKRPPVEAGELKTPGYRFQSPAPTTKKRSFWDSSVANSPSVMTVNGRKIRSHVSKEAIATPAAPSMLLQLAYPCLCFIFMLGPHLLNYYFLQPGFARLRTDRLKH